MENNWFFSVETIKNNRGPTRYMKKQLILVSGFITKNKKLLLGKRPSSKKYFPNHYEMPGGKLEHGENPEECIKREILEETGLKTEVVGVYRIGSTTIEETNEHCIIIYYLLNPLNETPKPLDYEELKWVTEQEIESLKTTEEQSEAIREGFNKTNKHHNN